MRVPKSFEFDSDFQWMSALDIVGARFQTWRALRSAPNWVRVPKSVSFQYAWERHLRNVLKFFHLWIWFWFSINECTWHSWRALSRLAHLGRVPNWVRIPKKVFYSIFMTKSLFNEKEKLFGTHTQCGARALVHASLENARQLYQVHSLIENQNRIQRLKHH